MKLDDLPKAIAGVCPSFKGSEYWLRELAGEDGSLLGYEFMSELVRHVSVLFAEGTLDEMPGLFRLIEQLVDDPDHYTSELAVVGFLEDLQNGNIHRRAGSRPADFERWFHPHTRWWWEELYLLWEGRIVPLGSSGRPRPPDMPWPLGRGGYVDNPKPEPPS
jgi:hypothetical protein